MSIQLYYQISSYFSGDGSSLSLTINLAPFLRGTPYEDQIPQTLLAISGGYGISGTLAGMSLAVSFTSAPPSGPVGPMSITPGF